ncbi:major facilitator superfamily domain-containing protein [Xylariaceae sp. FL1272]|nr:major facilitator superfamily domain-containing protein [Xylariaceae sp. FL1272]
MSTPNANAGAHDPITTTPIPPKAGQDAAFDTDSSSTPPYSIYSRNDKWLLVGFVGVAGLFSPLPANIYFPAIPALTAVFHHSTADLNLTVTIYLVLQGVSPMLWGPLSDRYGRRPLFLICLLILIGSSLGLALCPTSAFWLLLLLRALQAGGCASTIALGAGVIGDIATVDERGSFFGYFNLGPMLAPCIGPAVGGALSQYLGWRSIFWFLVIFSTACFVMLLLFLPETMRSLVGNGSITPTHFAYKPLVPIFKHTITTSPAPKVTQDKKNSVNPFRLFRYPDIILALTYTGIVYAVNYTITSTISSSYAVKYPWLSETIIGICYLSTGAGMILGSTINGKLLDYDLARIKKRRTKSCNDSYAGSDADLSIEYARLRMIPILLIVFVASTVGWGWCIEKGGSVAGPLVLQVILGYTSIAILNSTMTLMIDLIKAQSSGVIACTNFVRCSLAAILVALIDMATARLGYGWTYTLLGGFCALLLGVVYAEIHCGPTWRRKRDSAELL